MGNLADTSWFQEQIENEEEESSYVDSLLTTGFDEPYDHSIDTIDPDEPTDLPGPIKLTGNMVEHDISEQDEFFEGGEYNGIPEMEGTMEALEDLLDGIIGEPEFLGGR